MKRGHIRGRRARNCLNCIHYRAGRCVRPVYPAPHPRYEKSIDPHTEACEYFESIWG